MDAESPLKGLPNIMADYQRIICKGSDLVGLPLTSMQSQWKSISILGSCMSNTICNIVNFFLLTWVSGPACAHFD
jgi:hypothetical protein